MNATSATSAATQHSMGEARRHGLLSRLPGRLADALLDGAHRVEYPPGAIVSGWDERPRAAILLSGAMRAFLTSADGAQVTFRYLRPGDLLSSFEVRRPSLARTVQALGQSTMLHLAPGRLPALARSEPELAWALVQEFAGALEQSQRSYCLRAFGSIRVRVANAIQDRALASGQIQPGTAVRGTQLELANAVGSVREVVAATLQTLKRDGIIGIRRGGVIILDPARLQTEADGGLGFGAVD